MNPICRLIECDSRSLELVEIACTTHLTFEVKVFEAGVGKKVALVTFQHPVGFRVLDEGDLVEYWGAEVSLKSGWLYEVEANGWLAQEVKRDGFLSNITHKKLREFLAIGEGWCVSVLTEWAPTVDRYEPQPVIQADR